MENEYRNRLGSWINPAEEDLWTKLIDLKDTLDILDKQGLTVVQKEILQKCRKKVEDAEAAISSTWGGFVIFPILKKNFRIFWSLVHRVDEDIILFIPQEELLSRAIDVKTFFDLNIKEEKVREEWLGSERKKGKLIEAVEDLENGKNTDKNRHIIKDALRIVNEQIDRTFWMLSLNTMVSVLSGILLGILMIVFGGLCYTSKIESLTGPLAKEVVIIISLLGLMGAYISNLVTKEDFLFIKGPFWRYLFHHIISKPILSAFAAVFIYFLEKSKLIFSINIVQAVEKGGQLAEKAPDLQQIIAINVSHDAAGYVYAILAIASGFSADKVLRGMIDRVLKRLEEKAEKTKETKKGAAP